jgi:hypothetical protein
MIQESLDGVADAFRVMVKLPVWAKEDAIANASNKDIRRRSVYLYIAKNTNKCF